MKQLLQDLKSGKTWLEELPVPVPQPGEVLIKTSYSLVSLGTERMLVEFGKAGWIEKARQQPDKVKMVMDKVKVEGLKTTVDAVRHKLDQPLSLGYCNVGEIVELGEGVKEFKKGDRVISNGPHAEFVTVSKNLTALIPDEVTDEEAAFTVIGSIGLQGIRLLDPSFGDTVTVIGLGLIGLLTAQILVANGCIVLAYDLDKRKVKFARELGIEAFVGDNQTNPVDYILSKTEHDGVDGVIITASAKTDQIISDAARMCRKRGHIVLIGVVGLNISRAEFYEKELTFQVSSSYGPGRYDPDYEIKGKDYPKAFVPWTAKRNFEAVIEAIRSGKLKVKRLITETVKLDDFEKIYGQLGSSGSIASLLEYKSDAQQDKNIHIIKDRIFDPQKPVIGVVGAGNFTSMTLLPALKKLNPQIKTICDVTGMQSKALATKYDIHNCTSEFSQILNDKDINLVMIITRHHLHSGMAIKSLKAGKHVYVEKPLVLKETELEDILKTYKDSGKSIMVGYNRRFSPHTQLLKKYIRVEDPVNITATMNAGFIPANSWVQDPEIGGGRIIGEACHFMDLLIYLTGSKISSICMNALGKNPDRYSDNATILLKFENGSQGVINYFSNGAKTYSKERIEVYSRNRTFVIDNFRRTNGFGVKGFRSLKTKIDKGHKEQYRQLIENIETGSSPLIPFDELLNASKASFAALASLVNGGWAHL
jgi:predicted dehydrogenase/threonine dehydrogenase-like Zn-dependent dehydrogenase